MCQVQSRPHVECFAAIKVCSAGYTGVTCITNAVTYHHSSSSSCSQSALKCSTCPVAPHLQQRHVDVDDLVVEPAHGAHAPDLRAPDVDARPVVLRQQLRRTAGASISVALALSDCFTVRCATIGLHCSSADCASTLITLRSCGGL